MKGQILLAASSKREIGEMRDLQPMSMRMLQQEELQLSPSRMTKVMPIPEQDPTGVRLENYSKDGSSPNGKMVKGQRQSRALEGH
jgi:hypothetical protein